MPSGMFRALNVRWFGILVASCNGESRGKALDPNRCPTDQFQ